MDPGDREFMRQLLLRHEKATDAMIARLDEGTATLRAETQEIMARTEQIKRQGDKQTDGLEAHTREFVAEMRAQRQALFRLLYRLDAKGG
jgi:hypothetical protein